MKTINLLSKILILTGLIFCLLISTNRISAQNTSPLCFTARNGSVTVRFNITYHYLRRMQYSTDGTTWSRYTSNTGVTLSANQSIYFRAAINETVATAYGTGGYNTSSRFYFTSTDGGTVEGSGSIMSLYGPDCPNISLHEIAFSEMFYDCTLLTTAPDLPATNLNGNCYHRMFYGCTSLIAAPALPATTLATGCYSMMFEGCTSLIDPPTLPATTLAPYCYQDMFSGCTSLIAAPALPATTLADNCYSMMFEGCTSLIAPPTLPATTLVPHCYQRMFYDCTSMAVNTSGSGNTWSIPATASASYALSDMFTGTSGTMNGTPAVQTTYYITPEDFVANANANVSTMGSVSGSGSYYSGDMVTLTATPYTYHHFVGWSNGATTPVITFIIDRDTTFTANFAANLDYLFEDSATVFTGDSLVWRGRTLTTSGVYYDSLTTVLGYDSVYKLTLRITPKPLCFTARNGNVTVRFDIKYATQWIQYSTDKSHWSVYNPNTSVTINANQSIYFRAVRNQEDALPFYGIYHIGDSTFIEDSHFYFSSTNGGTVEGSGNIMSLYGPDCPNLPLQRSAFYNMFLGCRSLTTSPDLPATSVSEYCYSGMFQWCSSLTTASALPATTMHRYCYMDMFKGCTSLTAAPALPATTLDERCYWNMFENCTSLTVPPSLPATTLESGCYQEMFKGCTSMVVNTTGPGITWSIPATASASYALSDMFTGTSGTMNGTPSVQTTYYITSGKFVAIANANDSTMGRTSGSGTYKYGNTVTLTATPFANHHFVNWSNGDTIPVITFVIDRDTTVTAIFAANLDYLFEDSATIFTGDSLVWRGRTLTTTGVYYDSLTSVQGYDSVYKLTLSVTPKPLCFTARNGSVTVRFDIKRVTHTIQYSTNGTTWSTYTSNSNVTINANQSVYFRAAVNQNAAKAFGSYVDSLSSRFYFTSTNGGTVEGSGNIMSLYGPDCPNLPLLHFYVFSFMFYNCTSLTSAPALPATTLAYYCYYGMFSGCTSLTAAPALPATNLTYCCYFGMFSGCTSLTAAPALPATTLADNCYCGMFWGCTSLAAAPALPATTLAEGCYSHMFSGCTSLTAAPALPVTTLAEDCYSSMFFNCRSLTAAPALPATTLAKHCYSCMFIGCTSLTAAPVLPATTLAEHCYSSMFKDCTSLTAAPALPATTMYRYCYMEMFKGCTSLTTAPALSATTLAYNCCYGMFSGCTSLTTAPSLPATTLAEGCYWGMFWGCTSLTIPPSLPATTLADSCYLQMFKDCTSMVVNTTGPGITWSIPATVSATFALTDMFTGTSGTMNGTPTIQTTYYIPFPSYLFEDSATIFTGDSLVWRGRTLTTTGVYYDSLTSVQGYDSVYKMTLSVIPKSLCFTARNGSVTVRFVIKNATHTIQYSTDGTNWSNYTSNRNVTINPDQSVYFKAATNQTVATAFGTSAYNTSSRFYFSTSTGGSVDASGNIMSLYGPDCPDLPLQSNAFAHLFRGCTLLTAPPALPSTTLADNCYNYMFYGCTSLSVPPALPATTLADYCYRSMFNGCISLITPPVLPATTLANYCYSYMFYGCSSLTATPALPATTLAESCYSLMFYGCTSLVAPPAMPATTLTNYCYQQMFQNCTTMVVNKTGPGIPWSIPATVSATGALSNMFSGTSGTMRGTPSVQTTYYLTAGGFIATAVANNSTMGSTSGTGFYLSGDSVTMSATPNAFHHFVGWSNGATTPVITFVIDRDTTLTAIFAANPICMVEDSATICQGTIYRWRGRNLTAAGVYYDSLQTGADCDSVYKLTLTVNPTYFIQDSLVIHQGDSLIWHGKNLTVAGIYYDSLQSTTGCDSIHELTLRVIQKPLCFTANNGNVTVRFAIKSGIHTIQYSTDGTTWNNYTSNTSVTITANQSIYFRAAANQTVATAFGTNNANSCSRFYFYSSNGGTVEASGNIMSLYGPDCPDLRLQSYAFTYMFYGCTSLTAAPALPSTIMAANCYLNMFEGCTSLTTVPDLPATSLADGCYRNMFYGCTSLTAPPALPATTLIARCYNRMFYGCSSMKVYTDGPGIPWSIPATANVTTALTYMFTGTGGTMNGTPSVNTTYYLTTGGFVARANVNDTTMGIASGTGFFMNGDTVTMTATPKAHHHFVGWSNGVTTPLFTFVIDRDTTLTAIFAANPTYLIEDSATICPGGSYTWHGRNLTAAGVYYDSLTTVFGEDSVHRLTLTISPTYFIQESQSICQGDTYPWHGRNLTTAGTYYDSLQSSAGCDSIHRLTLSVNPTYFIQESHVICQGDTYSWHGRNLTSTGVYYDSLQTTTGCDSIYQLTLTVNPTYFIQESHSICQGSSYPWHGRNLTTSGVYHDSLQTSAGCDSIYQLTLSVNPTYFIQESHSICQGSSYPWHGRNLTTTGVYYDSLQTTTGCDSIYQLTLSVNPTYFIQESHSICQGSSYPWHGRNLTTSGVYHDSLQTTTGCDSIYRLTLTVNPTYFIQQTHTINNGDSYPWHGRSLTTAGVYYDSLQTTAGCDSIYQLTLTVNYSYLFEDSVTICRGDVYPWHGKNITKAGIYYDSLTTVSGCDSVYKLTVTINRHNVTLNTNDSTIGTVSGIGTYECGEKVQITATAIDSCHSFANWSDGNTNNPRTFVITSDTSFTAIFKKNVYTVTVSPNKANAGVAYCITNAGKDTTVTVECGETVKIHAESMGQYHFTGWSDGGTDSIRTISVTSDTNIVAIFKSNCGDMTHWPVEFKFNNLLIINLNALNAEGYYPEEEKIAWYMAVGDVDAVEEMFPVDDQLVCNGYYMSLIANGLGGGKYYAVIDAVDIGTPCTGAMKSEIIEYTPGSQKIRIEVAPTKVRNGEQVTVSGISPDETTIVRVYDYTGKLLQTIQTTGTEQCHIPTTASAGVYMINITSETLNETFKFVVTK